MSFEVSPKIQYSYSLNNYLEIVIIILNLGSSVSS